MGGDEDLRQEALQVVAEHCKLRATDMEDDEQDEVLCLRLLVCPFLE